jgi:hypothetical protein
MSENAEEIENEAIRGLDGLMHLEVMQFERCWIFW